MIRSFCLVPERMSISTAMQAISKCRAGKVSLGLSSLFGALVGDFLRFGHIVLFTFAGGVFLHFDVKISKVLEQGFVDSFSARFRRGKSNPFRYMCWMSPKRLSP